jgi:NAD(P)H-quinone oxidoreductase subunit 5
MGALGGAAIVVLAVLIAWPSVTADPRAWAPLGILALSLAPFFVRLPLARSWRTSATLLGAAVGVTALYAGWHAAFTALLPTPVAFVPGIASVAITLGAFAGLFVVQVLVSVRPAGNTARTLQAWAFAGFHLDELFTRATFLVWPPKHVRRATIRLRAVIATSHERIA